MAAYTPNNTYQGGLRLVDGNDMNQIANALSGKATGVILQNSSIYPAPGNFVQTAISTVGNGTIPAIDLAGGSTIRSGATAAFTDTTDTATNLLVYANALVPIGYSAGFYYNNTTGFPATLVGGTGITLAGSTNNIVPANSTAWFLMSPTSTTTVTMTWYQCAYNNWNGYDPSTVATQFGSGTGTFLEEGNLYRYASSTGISPGTINNDNVLAVYSMPANSMDGIGNRGITITAAGSVANNTNAKRLKLWFNATTAVVGSAITGGTLIADSGSYTTTGAAGWEIAANVFKYGAANSNTQIAIHQSGQIGSTVSSLISPSALTATENAAILIAVTGNATTATTDIVLNWTEINAMN